MDDQISNAAVDRVWRLQVDSAHPAAHGPVELLLRVDDSDGVERITWAQPNIAAVHRGAEKLFESRDYRQILMLADRHDWHSAFGSELGLAMTIEDMLGIQVPPRAVWIRTAMAELNRIIHHLRWLGETVSALTDTEQAAALRNHARKIREQLTGLHEDNTGSRIHPMSVVPGGVRQDIPDDWPSRILSIIPAVLTIAVKLASFFETQTQLATIGILDQQTALDYATSGPVARASGLALDLRIDEPYLNYAELAAAAVLTLTTRTGGSVQDRLLLLAEETVVATRCLQYAATTLADFEPGPTSVRLPRSIRVPQGSGYGWTENPTGINGWFLVSKGGPIPYRLKLRTASFNNAQALSSLLPGTTVDDLPATLMSFLLVAGDLAK